MWVQKTKSGKYAFIERYKTAQGAYKTASVTLDRDTPQSRKQAQRELSERISKIPIMVGSFTFREVIDAFIAEQKQTVKVSTWRRNESVGKTLSTLLGADNKVEKLTAGYIRSCLRNSGKPPVTLNEYIKRLKAMLRWAYRNDMLSNTACVDKLQHFKDTPHKEKIKDKYMDRAELNLVLKAMQNEAAKLMTKFLVLSGLRIGEALALTIKDVTKDEISVTKTYNSAYGTTTSPKTLTSTRRVHVQPELSTCLRSIKSFMLQRKLLTGHPEVDLLFVDHRGKHFSYAWYSRYLRGITEEVLGRRLSPHSLRHSHASILMENTPLDVISRRLGHENSRITREIYAHVTEELRKKDAKMIDATSFLG